MGLAGQILLENGLHGFSRQPKPKPAHIMVQLHQPDFGQRPWYCNGIKLRTLRHGCAVTQVQPINQKLAEALVLYVIYGAEV